MKKIKRCDVIKMIRSGYYENAAFELLKAMEPSAENVGSASAVWQAVRPYGAKRQEHFLVVLLNNNNAIIDTKVVSIGTVSETIVHPRELFRDAILLNASRLILAHNHPSGNLQPSNEDIAVTKRIIEAGKTIGIQCIDHVVFSPHSYLSMREEQFCSFS